MSHLSRKPSLSATLRAELEQQDLRRQRRMVVIACILVAVASTAFVVWEQLFPTPAEQLVKIYRVHGCSCTFGWAKSLEKQGYIVKIMEIKSLDTIRTSMRVPLNLRGCHVASHLGYFVEGHVAPDALRKLAREHPKALGVVTQAMLKALEEHATSYRDENSPVLLVDSSNQSRQWFEPQM